eukprot:13050_1
MTELESTEKQKVQLFNLYYTHNRSYFVERLFEVILRHKSIFIDDNKNEEPQKDIVAFFESFHPSYTLTAFLNDFDEYLQHEKSNKAYAETIYKTKFKNIICDISKCKCLIRNEEGTSIHPVLKQSKSIKNTKIAYIQFIDSIHVHLVHSFEIGTKLLESERKEIYDQENDISKISKVVRDKLNRCKSIRNARINDKNMPNKFVSKVDTIYYKKSVAVLFTDCLLKHAAAAHKIDHFTNFKTYCRDHEYDTDSIYNDIEFDAGKKDSQPSNIRKCINNDKYFDYLKEYLYDNSPIALDEKIYSAGFRYYYWTFFENNTNTKTVIYTNDKGKSWRDRGNVGHRFCDWYIPPKYGSIKEEVVGGVGIAFDEYNTEYLKAHTKLEGEYCKKMKANEFWDTTYGIKHNDPVQHIHILAIMLYCNHSKLCYRFSATYRKVTKFESNSAMKKRHSNYYHFGKALREAVEVFGTKFADSNIKIFYHGIDCDMYFKNCFAKICGPMSTTISFEVASGTFAQDRGIVLKLENDGATVFFMDCRSFSKYADEQERLFIGGYQSIPFLTIYKMNGHKDFKQCVQIIGTLCKMFSRNVNTIPSLKGGQIIKLNLLISCQIYDIIDSRLDEYEIGLFHHFCRNVTLIRMNMHFVIHNDMGMSKKYNRNVYGYNSLYPLFFRTDLDMIRLPFVFKLFPRIREIRILRWMTMKYNTWSDLSLELLRYILDSLRSCPGSFKTLKLESSAAMTPAITECKASHELQAFQTKSEHQYVCDRCGIFVESGLTMYGCFIKKTKCDYCVCGSCYRDKNDALKYLKQAIAFYGDDLRQISWKLVIVDHSFCFKRQ